MEMKKVSDSYYHASYMCLCSLAMQNAINCSFESNKRWNKPPNLRKSLNNMNICSINKIGLLVREYPVSRKWSAYPRKKILTVFHALTVF
jgi:hypothetical protein